MRKLITAALSAAALLALVVIVGGASASRPVANPVLWAVVDVDGHLAYGSGAVSSRQVGADGTYEVVFDRDVSRCAYVAVAGDYTGDSYAGPDDAITVGAAPWEGNANGVFLLEYDAILARDNYSSGFHLIVAC
jgi:hypothetical protein